MTWRSNKHSTPGGFSNHGSQARLHSLRSTAIVAVLEATGGNLLAAKEMARHENIATTIGRYAQDAAQARVAAADAMDRVMARKEGLG